MLPDLERVVGDAAYGGQNNLENAEKEKVELIAKVNHRIIEWFEAEKEGFFFNKDAGRVVCPAIEVHEDGRVPAMV